MSNEADDESRARAVLAEMQERVTRGPHATLGITTHATATDIRTAFLQLTKIYHPARFARMAVEIQRLSNEVFLTLRAAHDSLAKPRQRERPTSPLVFPNNHTTAPPIARPVATRTPTPVALRTPTQIPPLATKPPAQTQTARSAPTPTLGPAQPRAATGSPQQARRNTPPSGVRVSTPTTPAGVAPRSTPPTVERELIPIYELMQQKQWEPARAAISVLAARTPSTKYQALLCYTRGREAQLERRIDEARVELDSALQLDPDLQLAKTALAELFTRRK